MAGRLSDFHAAGVAVVAVSMSRPDAVAQYLADRAVPLVLLADPDRKLYSALGLGRTSWARLLRPSVVWKYLRLIAGGGKVRRVPAGEDALQLGGDFLLDRECRVVWAYRGTDPTDRPSIDALLQAIRQTFRS